MNILYITDQFPKISELFIIHEVFMMERNKNVKINILSIGRSEDNKVHNIAQKIKANIFYARDIKVNKLLKYFYHLYYLLTHPARYIDTYFASKDKGLPSLKYTFRQVPLYCNMIKKQKIDWIHCHFGRSGMLTGWLISRMLKVPFSVTLHGSDVLVSPYDSLGTVLNDAGFVVTVSRIMAKKLQETFGVSRDKINVISCGIFPETFSPTLLDPKELKILSVARLHPVKGLSFLIDACAILGKNNIKFKCSIVGEGEERVRLEYLIKRYGLEKHIILRGAVTNEELPEIYSNHTVFVLPSLSEGLGVVLMEAMASGLPVVATNVGGIPEIIEDGVNGILVPPNNSEKIAEAIDSLTLNSDIVEQIRKNNINKANQYFDIKRQIDSLYSLFEKHISANVTRV